MIGTGYYRYRSPFSAEIECAPMRVTVYHCASCGAPTTIPGPCNMYDFDRDEKCGGATVCGTAVR